MSDFDEHKAENQLSYMMSCLDALPDNPNMLSQKDVEDWRPNIQNICKKTKNPSLQQTGEEIITKLDQLLIKLNKEQSFSMHAILEKPEILLVGVCVRTNNKQEVNKMDGRIFPLVRKYFHEALAEKIPLRKTPGTTFCAYTNYESDQHGDYTYFIGEQVTAFDERLSAGFQTLTVPAQTYAKFTTKPAPMPDVLLKVWNTVWNISPQDLGGKRTYVTDFELYDERAKDHQNIVLDLYIAIKPTI
jgi:predicted transcriptional regulator YdeE